MSTPAAILADHLSRGSTTSTRDRDQIRDARTGDIPFFLHAWLRNPAEDWHLPMMCLKHVKSRLGMATNHLHI
jgi:hypothetical protein